MRRKGLLYHYNWPPKGEVIVALTRGAKVAYGLAKTAGSALIVAGLAGVIFTLKPVVTSELSYKVNTFLGRGAAQEEYATRTLRQAIAQDTQEKETARKLAAQFGVPDTQFSIYVPKIGAKAQVLQNVDPAEPKVYMEALTKGVAHAAGSVFPGMEGGTYLFAHSTNAPWNVAQYNAVFYLLRELDPGDEIYVFFLDRVYKYRMTEKEVVDAKDISWLVNAKKGPERIILQSCWPPGTTWKRLIVVAEPVKF